MRRKSKFKRIYIKEQYEIENTEQLLTLMGLYLSEWKHRDSLFWKQIFTYFFSSLVVMLLPFMEPWGLHLPAGLPDWLFPGVGLMIAVAFFIVSNGYIVRLKAVSEPYGNLIKKLPPDYRRKTIKQLHPGLWGSILNWRMTFVICLIMFLSLLAIGVVLLYFTLI